MADPSSPTSWSVQIFGWVMRAIDASLVAEPFDPAAWRVHELAREQLDGDGPIESRIARTVDLAHSPGTERCQDLERAETVVYGS